jgi:diaminopimelate decarboxylase
MNRDAIQGVMEAHDSPFFFYDLDAFEAHMRAIREVLDPSVKVWYACKANPLSRVLSILQHNGFGVDVASLGELHQAKTAGVERLIATGPAKSMSYLGKLLDAGVETIICESPQQVRDLNQVASERRLKPSVLLRVQLDWEGDLRSVLGGSAVTPFGIGVDDWKKVSLSEYTNLSIKGLHCFQWGNVLDLGQLQKVWRLTIQRCQELASELRIPLDVLDLGGGLGVSYQDERSLPFSQVHELLLGLRSEHKLRELWLELGRFSIAEFGSYFAKVIDVKSVRGKNLVVTEGGINHIARPALVNEAFPCSLWGRTSGPTKTFRLHGPLCTALDFLGEFDLPADLRAGDWLEFRKAGAYGFTESMPYFLCHQQAGEVISHRGKVETLRAPESAAHWLR